MRRPRRWTAIAALGAWTFASCGPESAHGPAFDTRIAAQDVERMRETLGFDASVEFLAPPRTPADDLDRMDPAKAEVPEGPVLDEWVEGIDVTFPDATYRVIESSLLEKELRDAFPGIRCFRGQGTGPEGLRTLRAFRMPAERAFAFDELTSDALITNVPLSERQRQALRAAKIALPPGPVYVRRTVRFGPGDRAACAAEADRSAVRPLAPETEAGPEGLRVYRVAMAGTPRFLDAFRKDGKLVEQDALLAFVKFVNRADLVFEREIGARLVVAGPTLRLLREAVLPLDETEKAGAVPSSADLARAQREFDRLIPDAGAYDIGHLICRTGGGRADIGGACVAGRKAKGITGCPAPSKLEPVTTGTELHADDVLLGTFAHELGHQLGAHHTHGLAPGGHPPTAVEIGSGETIMSWTQRPTRHFHSVSVAEIRAVASGTGSGHPEPRAVPNRPPRVATSARVAVPKDTPFVLQGSGSDDRAEDVLTHGFDEWVFEGTPGNWVPPLHGWRAPERGGRRAIPREVEDFSIAGFPAGTGTPRVRDLRFRHVVRDNRGVWGGVSTADVVVTPDPLAGPLTVAVPTRPVGGSTVVTWRVRDTARLSPTVDALLWRKDTPFADARVLGTGLPNNGRAALALPAGEPGAARIRIQSTGGTFLAHSPVFEVGRADARVLVIAPHDLADARAWGAALAGVRFSRLLHAPSQRDHAVAVGRSVSRDPERLTEQFRLENLEVAGDGGPCLVVADPADLERRGLSGPETLVLLETGVTTPGD